MQGFSDVTMQGHKIAPKAYAVVYMEIMSHIYLVVFVLNRVPYILDTLAFLF